MSASCLRVRDLFERYAKETLSGEQRRAVRDHLAACADCRARACAADPLFLFASASPATLPEEESARILEAVRAGVALKQSERKIGTPPRRHLRWAAVGSAAAALVLTLAAPGALSRRDARTVERAPRQPIETGFIPASAPAPAGDVFGKKDETRKYPADATIYDWNPGAGQPRVVWIVDRSIDI